MGKRTISFIETKEILKSLCSCKANVGGNFNEFIKNYISSASKLFDVVDKATSHDGITDFSNEVVQRENQWLFTTGEEDALDIVVRQLNNLNNGDKSKPTWTFIDCGKKAVVHFIQKKEWYAEVYFFSHVESSYLHLVNDGSKKLVSVTFTSDMSNIYSHVATAGGYFLRDYLPREKMDILRKGGGRCKKTSSLAKQNKLTHKDEGDKL